MSNTEWKSPVYNVIAVPFEKIVPNTYNPNAVAPPEMKLLYDRLAAKYPTAEYLSVGMSGDYEKAVMHGANMIRPGSLLFGERVYPVRTKE